jgi:hypothetical protein
MHAQEEGETIVKESQEGHEEEGREEEGSTNCACHKPGASGSPGTCRGIGNSIIDFKPSGGCKEKQT